MIEEPSRIVKEVQQVIAYLNSRQLTQAASFVLGLLCSGTFAYWFLRPGILATQDIPAIAYMSLVISFPVAVLNMGVCRFLLDRRIESMLVLAPIATTVTLYTAVIGAKIAEVVLEGDYDRTILLFGGWALAEIILYIVLLIIKNF